MSTKLSKHTDHTPGDLVLWGGPRMALTANAIRTTDPCEVMEWMGHQNAARWIFIGVQ
jgi:hypothetical protein